MKGFDPYLLLNVEMGVLVEENQGYATALNQLMSELLSEHQDLRDQRDKLRDSSKVSRASASELQRDH